MTKEQFETRVNELIAKGYSPRAAERRAAKERKQTSPQHKAAVARNVEAATLRYEATSEFKF